MADILVLYYSRTGSTKKIAEELSGLLDADLEEVIDLKKRNGFTGFMRAGMDALLKRHTSINKISSRLGSYKLVVIGTPVWAGTMAPAIRRVLNDFSRVIKKAAFFSTQASSRKQNVFLHMRDFIEPIATLKVTSRELKTDLYKPKLRKFVEKLKSELK